MNRILNSYKFILFIFVAVALAACRPSSPGMSGGGGFPEEPAEEPTRIVDVPAEEPELPDDSFEPQPAILDGIYLIQAAGSGRFLHEDSGGDHLLSTRYQPDDDFVRFIFEHQSDGSYRIRVKATNLYLHEDGMGDRLLSTRAQETDDFTRFFLDAQPDGSFQIRVKANDRYWHEDGGGDLLVSTRYQPNDIFTHFWLIADRGTIVVEAPEPPVQSEDPEPPVQPEAPEPPVQPEAPEPPVQPEAPEPPEEPKAPEPPQDPNRDPINNYVWSLNYNPNALLQVQENGSTHSQPLNSRTEEDNAVLICTKIDHTLRENLSEVAILRPTNGVIYPGALVQANGELVEGKPVPISLPREQMTLSIDLPGLSNSSVMVDEPANNTVQSAINQKLEEWNAVFATQGYVNANRSVYKVKTAYEMEQIALELGLNAKWLSGTSLASQLNVSNSTENSSVVAYYKQVFYTVSMETPREPADLFAESVTAQQVQHVVNGNNPPAYVRSVDYGRIIVVKMETSSSHSKVDLEAAMNRAMTVVEVGGSINASYEQILQNSTFTVVTIGGGTQDTQFFSGINDLSRMGSYVKDGAVYSRSNPGLPIAYTITFLKDNSTAKMGLATDYTETRCVASPNGFIKLIHAGAYVAKFTVTWMEPDGKGGADARSWNSGDKTAGFTHHLPLPGDAYNVRIRGWAYTGLIWDPEGQILDKVENGPTNKCYRVYGTTLEREWERKDC